MAAKVAHPESIVETNWVAEHLNDDNVAIVEVDVDTAAYEQGHVPGAVGWNWTTQLNDTVTRDILSKEQMQGLLGGSGIAKSTTVVLYGDNNNWFAAYAFWQMKLYGHRRLKLMNGGRQKWVDEGRDTSTDVPSPSRRIYRASDADPSIRATRDYVLDVASTRNNVGLIDVRAPAEFSGELLAPANLPQEGSQRGGHIPGAANVPWATAVNEADGTFKTVEELRDVYLGKGLRTDSETIAYCRIGERSSHTWFVLSEILGFSKVRNYDGSWTEYGSIVGAPIEK
ncbi:MAG: sulfurtransferase [SAR202 cluster bacterium Io17-Chloro-G9]|nr:MAG: sulfurtransferase [SAR202 cluster bacterium Io17-Chloro-G9]